MKFEWYINPLGWAMAFLAGIIFYGLLAVLIVRVW